jgi:beta-lactamase class D
MTLPRRDMLRGVLTGLLLPGAATAATATPSGAPPATAIDIGERFRARDLTGTFALLAVHDDTLLLHHPARADQEFLPASTFKIPNSLIALETGVIKDPDEVWKYDGAKTGPPTTWHDQSLRTGIQESAVWMYQEIARRVGEKRMQEWVDRLGYGNRNIGGGLDTFWLTGDIRITARQQIDFLRRLYKNDLPFSPRTIGIVKDILIHEKTDAHVLRGKTGMAGYGGTPTLGWFVGWLERGERAWVFAMNVDYKDKMPTGLRKELTIEILRALGAMEAA